MRSFISETSSHLEVIMMLIISCQKAHFLSKLPVAGSWRTSNSSISILII
jgi:hypothetical protein